MKIEANEHTESVSYHDVLVYMAFIFKLLYKDLENLSFKFSQERTTFIDSTIIDFLK